MEKISWTDRVRNEEVLHRVKEERNILHSIKRTKANWIGHILRRNYVLKHVIEGKLEGRIEIKERRGRTCKQLLDGLKEKRIYWKLTEEALDRTLWRNRKRLRTCCKTDYRMNEWPRSRSYVSTTALRLLVQPCNEDEEKDDQFFFQVMEHRWNEIDRGKPKYSRKILCQCHFVYHKPHMD
jgi:hypothetical protein